MGEIESKKAPVCTVCGRKLWYDHTLKDGNEEWVCPVRWIGPDLLKKVPKDAGWTEHESVIRAAPKKNIRSLSNKPRTLKVREYLERALPDVIQSD